MNKNDIIINTSKLTKYYGKQLGIEDVNLEVKRGEVFGYLGPNGSGKTTTIRVLLDFIRPTRGSAMDFDLEARLSSVEIHRRPPIRQNVRSPALATNIRAAHRVARQAQR